MWDSLNLFDDLIKCKMRGGLISRVLRLYEKALGKRAKVDLYCMVE